MKKFGIIEVGSTSTKGYGYDNNEVEEKEVVTIKFKENYKKEGKILEEDKQKLYEYVNNLREEYGHVEVYGTGIFTKLEDEVKKKFSIDFFCNTGINFDIVTEEMENKYIAYGAIANIKHSNKLAIMISGGTATEVIIVENGKIIERALSKIGAFNIIQKYPDIMEDVAKTEFNVMVEEISKMCHLPQNKSDVLILAGGNYLKFYETLNYPLKDNIFYQDENQPYYLDKVSMDDHDYNYFYHTSLENVKKDHQDVKIWWDGTRGMRICIKVIADALGAKFIIPTKLSMVYGIIEKLKKEK